MNLLLLEPGEVDACGDVQLSGHRARHLLSVLRAVPGQSVRVGVLDGPIGTGVVLTAGPDRVALRCAFGGDVAARPRVDVLLALPRPKVLGRLWAQFAALGVGRIIVTNAARVERSYFDTHILTPEYYQPLLVEGLQQASDTRLPPVSVHRRFRVLVEDDLDGLFPSGIRLVADPSASRSPSDGVGDRVDQRALLAVGPEGGWNGFETRLLEARGFHPIGMGRRTLRTDTACIALLALVHDALSGPPRGRGPSSPRARLEPNVALG